MIRWFSSGRRQIYVPASFLVLGVIVVAVHAAVQLVDGKENRENNTATFEALPETDDPFTLGQYYFNHGDDPASPYDLKLKLTT